MAGHVVVIGLGSVGIRVVEGLLAEGRRVVVVERDDDNRYLGRARALGVPVVIADATQRQTHSMVNLADASAVAILTSADLTNIETGLAVRESLGGPVGAGAGGAAGLRPGPGPHDGARTSASATCGRRRRWPHRGSSGAALGLDVLETFYVDQQPFLVGRLPIAPGGGLEGLAMQDLSARTRVIALVGQRAAGASNTRRAGAPASRAATRRICSAPTRNSCGCCDGTSCRQPGADGPNPASPSAEGQMAAPQTVVDDQPAHDVGVHVGVGTPVLEPALLVLGHGPRDADRGAPVGGAIAELRPVRRLVRAGQALGDARRRSS